MHENGPDTVGFDLLALGFEVLEGFHAEGAAEVTEEDQHHGGLIREVCKRGAVLIVVGLDRVLKGHCCVSCEVDTLMILRADHEQHREGHPPDQIVGDDGPDELDREFLSDKGGVDESDRAKYFSEEPDEDDGPMREGITGGDEVSDAVHADDHPDALPDRWVGWLGEVHDREQ